MLHNQISGPQALKHLCRLRWASLHFLKIEEAIWGMLSFLCVMKARPRTEFPLSPSVTLKPHPPGSKKLTKVAPFCHLPFLLYCHAENQRHLPFLLHCHAENQRPSPAKQTKNFLRSSFLKRHYCIFLTLLLLLSCSFLWIFCHGILCGFMKFQALLYTSHILGLTQHFRSPFKL